MYLGAAFLCAFALAQVPPNEVSHNRYIAFGNSEKLRQEVERRGGKVLREMSPNGGLVVIASEQTKAQLTASPFVTKIVPDRLSYLVKPGTEQSMGFKSMPEFKRHNKPEGDQQGSKPQVGDPGVFLPGLMWNLERINAPKTWRKNTGKPSVRVAVADTGMDYTHPELQSQIETRIDFSDPTSCLLYRPDVGLNDTDWAAITGGPADGDFSGHGTWMGGNIAAALDSKGINGIAPHVQLVSLKIAQWCGLAFDSSILSAIKYAADNGIDVISIAFGNYLDRNDPEQEAVWQLYVDAVRDARSKGTVVVAAGGNDHVRVDSTGQVSSHSRAPDLFGYWQYPGGIPGVIMVSSTINVVGKPSKNCAPGTFETWSNATCKRSSDTHQPFGIGRKNQLAANSNYGPRVDVAAPGGSHKFNLPYTDGGGTFGFPWVTTEGYNAYGGFSTMSAFSVLVACTADVTPDFVPGACYATLRGTSEATAHVSGVLGLIASESTHARHNVDKLVGILKRGAQRIGGNAVPPWSANDKTPTDLDGSPCDAGYCHLGGRPIPDREAYGAGLVDASASVVMIE